MKIQSGEVFGYITDDNAIEPYVRPARIGDTWTTPEGVEVMVVPVVATNGMNDNAREWSRQKYGKPIGTEASDGCWAAMIAAAQAYDEGPPDAMLAAVKETADDPR